MANIVHTSKKYQEIITKSRLIRSGSPKIYQLEPKKEKIGNLTRITFGEKNPMKINKTILLVGETGAGKSLLINALLNFTMGVKWEDDVWFKIVQDQTSGDNEETDQSDSQTSDVTVYQIFGFEGETLPYSLTIIDTPGFGHTRGIKRDALISERLLDWFKAADGVHEINAVGLVLKATENRLSPHLRYILNSVVSLFGKNMEKNVVALITHSHGTKYKKALKALKAANIKCAKDENNQPVHFLFDNCQHEDRTEDEDGTEDEDDLEDAFNRSTKGLTQFTEFLKEKSPERLKLTVDVLRERKRLTACMVNLRERVKFVEEKQREIEQTEEALQKHTDEMERNKNFTIEVDEPYKIKTEIDVTMGGCLPIFYTAAVTCKKCEETCHYKGCTVAWYPSHCEVMKNGHCTVCTRRCPASDHVKEKWIYETKTKKVKKTEEQIKQRYEENKKGSEKKMSLLENLEENKKKLTAEKDEILEECFSTVVKLEQIALKVNSLSTLVHVDFLLEKMDKNKDAEKIRKLEEMRSRVDEGTRAAVEYQKALMKKEKV